MKKALLYCGIALLTAVLPGCKEMKDDIDTLKRPYPTGITLLQSEITVLNGSTLKVPFRVNPSNYIVQAEDLRLDAHPFADHQSLVRHDHSRMFAGRRNAL